MYWVARETISLKGKIQFIVKLCINLTDGEKDQRGFEVLVTVLAVKLHSHMMKEDMLPGT